MDYNALKRDPQRVAFYNSVAWKRCRGRKLAETPWCEHVTAGEADPCGMPAKHVHHVLPITTPEGWERRLDQKILRSLCIPCHNAEEATGPPMPLATGGVELVEGDTYCFDAEAAARPIRFIEKFCRHTEGKFAGQPFTMLQWQRDLVRTLFGWKRRDTGLRRFRELYLLSAKGAGKTPLLAAIGLYMLLGDGEAAPHVISMASTFEQANLTFGGGKAFIRESPDLSQHAEAIQFQIRTRGNGKWTTVSGKPNGRSGPRPSCIIADECHEWPAATGDAFDLLCANLFKRAQPLLLVATNAGNSRTSFAWRVHERAVAVLNGKLHDETLLPIIYEAGPELPWDSEDAAAAANPSLGEIVQWHQLAPELERAKQNTVAEARYRRLYLSQWINGGANKWLDVPGRWMPCVETFDPAKLANAALYVGLDLSKGDDLCAAVFVYTTPDRIYVASRFWLPKQTAEQYERKNSVPFSTWAAAGAITLLDEPTISSAVQRRIADEIASAGQPVAVCYDRFAADEVVAQLASKGIECRPIAQGYTVGPGVAELDRRLIEKSVTIAPNPVLEWNAENVELKTDDRGNSWPVKPRAQNTYAGIRSVKIDGIAALVTALTEARKHDFPSAAQKWAGRVLSVSLD